jgi:hypothetical protein
MAVAPWTVSLSSARSVWVWSVLGSESCSAAVLKETRPRRNSSGSVRLSARAAVRAAVTRSGRTSVAFIDNEVSCTSMTVPCRCSTATVRSGRAIASASTARAASASAAGMWRPQARPATVASTSTAG